MTTSIKDADRGCQLMLGKASRRRQHGAVAIE
ncbi:TPA: pilus assembly protein, partial [Pseudomonas aeruginosa]